MGEAAVSVPALRKAIALERMTVGGATPERHDPTRAGARSRRNRRRRAILAPGELRARGDPSHIVEINLQGSAPAEERHVEHQLLAPMPAPAEIHCQILHTG